MKRLIIIVLILLMLLAVIQVATHRVRTAAWLNVDGYTKLK